MDDLPRVLSTEVLANPFDDIISPVVGAQPLTILAEAAHAKSANSSFHAGKRDFQSCRSATRRPRRSAKVNKAPGASCSTPRIADGYWMFGARPCTSRR